MTFRKMLAVAALVPAISAWSAGPALVLPELSEKQAASFRESRAAGSKAYEAKDYARAVRHLTKATTIVPDNEGVWYDLACVHALAGRPTLAMDALEKALDAGWREPTWPAEDADLTSLHGTPEFEGWLDRVKRAALAPTPRPVVPAADLTGDPTQIDELADAAQARLQQVAALMGGTARERETMRLAEWRAGSWDRVARETTDPKLRAEAEMKALEALVDPYGSAPISSSHAAEVIRRAEAFRASHPTAPEAATARFYASVARHRDAWSRDEEGAQVAADQALVQDLLMIAATEPPGDGTQRALVRLLATADYLPEPELQALHARLRRDVGDDEKFRDIVVREARGVHYRLSGLPEFEVVTLDGRTVTPESLRGRVTLLDFWATWCGPCRGELPHLKKAWNQYHDRGFDIIGISLDNHAKGDASEFKAWCEKNELPWPQVFDGKGWQSELADAFGVKSIPFPLLIDTSGRVAFADSQLRGEQLLDRVESLLPAGRPAEAVGGQ